MNQKTDPKAELGDQTDSTDPVGRGKLFRVISTTAREKEDREK